MRKRIFVIILILCIFYFFLPAKNIYAHTVGDIFSDGWLAKGNSVGVTINNGQVRQTSNFIYKILLAIGIVIMFIVGTILGIQFIIGGVDGKAKIKEKLIPYIVGCAIILGAFTIWGITINVMQGKSTGSVVTGSQEQDENTDEDEDESNSGSENTTAPVIKDPFEGMEEDNNVIIASKPKRVNRVYDIVNNYNDIPSYIKKVSSYAGNTINIRNPDILVYLPYGYTESKKYDVLFLLHGDGGGKTNWITDKMYNGVSGKDILDNAIANELCDPLIVVSVNYTAGNEYAEPLINAFKNEILSYVVKHYSTYVECNESDSLATILAEIEKQRDHFGIAGASRGGNRVRACIYNLRNYMSWFGYLSGYNNSVSFSTEPAVNYIYCAAGKSDSALGYTRSAYNSIKNNPLVLKSRSDIITPAGHDWRVWYASLYNIIQLFFDKAET